MSVPLSLCTACSRISVEALEDGYEHLANARDLRVSSKTCQLCHLIRLSFNQDTAKEIDNHLEDRYYNTIVAEEPIVIYGALSHADDGDEGETTDGGLRLQGLSVQMPLVGDELDITNLTVFGDPSSKITEDGQSKLIAGRPPLLRSDTLEAFDLVRHWLQTCKASNGRCKQYAGDPKCPPMLPTRVLDVSEGNIHVLVTNGRSAQYAALSHCWGRNPPLRTLTSNLADHLTSIEFSNLPRTFQHAVLVTRELGYQYIWIDSLCIIQDDNSDWEREAARMSTVYGNADITIAATGSSNSMDGLFIERPKSERPVPFHIYQLNRPVQACASLSPESAMSGLHKSPLADRGWITQEWLLSRRIVHFGRQDLRWVCRSLCETETGEGFLDSSGTQQVHNAVTELLQMPLAPRQAINEQEEDDYDDPSWDFIEEWLVVLTAYGRRKLTYTRDKRVALQGIIDSLSSQTGLKSHYAVWGMRFHNQLFWCAGTKLCRPLDLAHLPSWSCLSTYGRIYYHTPTISGALPHDKNTGASASVVPYDGRRLQVHARVFEYTSIEGPFSLNVPANEKIYSAETIAGVKAFQDKTKTYMGEGEAGLGRIFSERFFGIHGVNDNPIGWITFDEGVAPEVTTLCVQLCVYQVRDRETSSFLVVRPDETKKGVWLRVGMGETIDSTPMQDAKWRDIVIE